jgi:hypothetical protein
MKLPIEERDRKFRKKPSGKVEWIRREEWRIAGSNR